MVKSGKVLEAQSPYLWKFIQIIIILTRIWNIK